VKIAILSWNFPPKQAGGTEIATQIIASNLTKRGHEVLVVTTLDKGFPEKNIVEGFHVFRVRSLKPKQLKYAFYCLRAPFVLRRFRPDIIHVQSMGPTIPAIIARILTGTPFLVWGRGSDVYVPGLIGRVLLKIGLRNADTVVALTEHMKIRMQKSCSKDIVVIGNGVYLEKFNTHNKSEIRQRLGINGDEKIVIFVGTLCPIKGVKYLIEAMRTVVRIQPYTRLLILGDGVEANSLEKLVHNLNLGQNVTFSGRVDNGVVPDYLACSDVFVLPSLSEGFPVTFCEAMASGLPIVSTRVEGLSEIVSDGINGFLVEPASPAQLADKILLLLNNNALRDEISINNKGWAKLNSWDHIVDRIEEIYSKTISRGQHTGIIKNIK
jgi:glycosyltransferase involved in cell wall biosynthesis